MPDVTFSWMSVPDGARTVRMFFDGPTSIGVDEFRDLVVGADHAHDEDTLEAVMASFADRHGYELVSFDPGGAGDPLDEQVSVAFRRRPFQTLG